MKKKKSVGEKIQVSSQRDPKTAYRLENNKHKQEHIEKRGGQPK
ncbi:MAG: hypothetical protein ABIK62_02610 [candidate division WOR-3 bacterium]